MYKVKINSSILFMLGLSLSPVAMAGSTQQSSGYFQDSPEVYANMGNFTVYFYQVLPDSNGHAVAPVVPPASSSGSCGTTTSLGGVAGYGSGMTAVGFSCVNNIYGINIKFSDNTWWTVVNPKVVSGNAGPQALIDGCAGNILYDNNGMLVYSDALNCIRQY